MILHVLTYHGRVVVQSEPLRLKVTETQISHVFLPFLVGFDKGGVHLGGLRLHFGGRLQEVIVGLLCG